MRICINERSIIYRNNSLWVIGGNDGFLHNDMQEIPLTPIVSLQSQSNRDISRSKSYCSFIDDCQSCNKNTLCIWCNGACAYNQDKNPLQSNVNTTNSGKTLLMGELDNGLCPLPLPSSLNCSERTIYFLIIIC